MKLIRNPFFLGGVGIYLGAVFLLARGPEFSLSDTLLELLILGLGLPLLAWLATIRARELPTNVHPGRGEIVGVVAYVVVLSIYLAIGPQTIDSRLPQAWVASERIHFFISVTRKLIVFVLLPFLLFGPFCGYSIRDFGLRSASWREAGRSHLPVILLVSGALLIFQYFFGGAAAPLREGALSPRQLLVGMPLCFIALAIEAGLVEEFFFRGLLQARFSPWFGSEVTGVVLMSLCFGLAHAPGFIFRGAGNVEGLGTNPTALDAIAYSIATISVSGILFGVVWARTKSLVAVILIHAATDLFPNVASFVKVWGL